MHENPSAGSNKTKELKRDCFFGDHVIARKCRLHDRYGGGVTTLEPGDRIQVRSGNSELCVVYIENDTHSVIKKLIPWCDVEEIEVIDKGS